MFNKIARATLSGIPIFIVALLYNLSVIHYCTVLYIKTIILLAIVALL